ncbi:fluoride efflux transporter CrcB [Fodinisporobacter ferrooxydans]|uniref:Fluoride-specific ion channel FluC n=1 Tax=Fodinisporobacter ferrooxydans TaxID=2901836 RepID=A0ABY4CTW4_9BACL|nr:fluoride efflux transporter CrcB [Alicyclobacillaceae bacterium MYW30-H2]
MLIVGFGGMFGANARHYLGRFVNLRTQSSFPWGTWVINLSGSLLLGLLSALFHSGSLQTWAWRLLGIGFCGAYTTFSTFGYETIQLLEKGKIREAFLYIVSSVCLAVGCAWIGYQFG